ncbi:serine/threonine-protein kinase [Sphaerisporangium perillae]|uniref:serine/threonine-protein kinase n=1 Tax=Sphaerisporangium perillae TaxID=2935860 RepID=UPI00200E68A7|nr:serine/threonine-protein kinase [Sphaerisporangium perillae]
MLLAARYRLDEPLGRGGMGEVWRATDEVLNRPVAVKLLLAEAVSSSSAAARFRQEAQATARLNHANVVAVHDFGEAGDRLFLVMELIEGRSLADHLAATGPLSVAEVTRIGAQAAAGLAAAHRLGVIHRDIKPGNLLLTADGTVKVVDFGIARLADQAAAALTRTGLIVGTSTYLAPERALGGDAGPASDVYALGCVLYELLAGHPPFRGDTSTAVLYQHVQVAPAPPRRLRGDLPPALDDLLMRLLAKKPDARPSADQTAHWLATASASPTGPPLSPTGPPPTGTPTRPASAPQTGTSTRMGMATGNPTHPESVPSTGMSARTEFLRPTSPPSPAGAAFATGAPGSARPMPPVDMPGATRFMPPLSLDAEDGARPSPVAAAWRSLRLGDRTPVVTVAGIAVVALVAVLAFSLLRPGAGPAAGEGTAKPSSPAEQSAPASSASPLASPSSPTPQATPSPSAVAVGPRRLSDDPRVLLAQLAQGLRWSAGRGQLDPDVAEKVQRDIAEARSKLDHDDRKHRRQGGDESKTAERIRGILQELAEAEQRGRFTAAPALTRLLDHLADLVQAGDGRRDDED